MTVKWDWHTGQNTEARRIAGQYKHGDREIKIFLNTIMEEATSKQSAQFILEETVLHELTHWAAEHEKASNRHTGFGHSERYRKVLENITDTKKPRQAFNNKFEVQITKEGYSFKEGKTKDL